MRAYMQIDMGFGDVVTPSVVATEYPTILDHDPPRLNGYSRETTVAEKFEAMVKLGQLNSRIRDFFDIWLLARQFDFEGRNLADAVRRTFENRGTPVNIEPVALTPEFASDAAKQTQWSGFCRKSRIDSRRKLYRKCVTRLPCSSNRSLRPLKPNSHLSVCGRHQGRGELDDETAASR